MKSKFTRSLSTLILGVFTLLLINSCKKEFLTTPLEDLTSSKITKNGVSIESINFKTFKSEVDFNKLGNLKTTFEKGSEFNSRILLDADAKSNIEIDLSSVKKLTVKGKISYVFSIKSSSPRAVSFSNLTIEQNVTKDSLKAFMTVYTPKKEWIKAYHNKETLSFNGSIEFQKIDLNQIKDVKQGIGSSITTNSTSAWTQVCLSYTVYEHVEVSCAGTGSANHTYKNRDACDDNGTPLGPTIELQARQVTECSTIADPNYDPSNPPSGGGTGDPTNPDTYGGSTTPTPPSGYNPCDSGGEQSTINSINGVQVLVAGDSPCDPNNPTEPNPIPPTGSPSFIITRDITIINNPKVNCILNRLEGKDANGNNTQTKYDDLLLAFSNNNNWNLTYKLGLPVDQYGQPVMGQTQRIPNSNNFNIIFNQNSTDILSSIIGKTFIHEAFHAYLNQKALETWGSLNPNQWINDTKDLTLNELFTYIEVTKGKTMNDISHNFMAANIDRMIPVLKEFIDPDNSLNLPEDTYKGLLYQGLHESEYYKTNILGSTETRSFNGITYSLSEYFNNISSIASLVNLNCN